MKTSQRFQNDHGVHVERASRRGIELQPRVRRDTLRFDAVLYRDSQLEVTPSIVIIGRPIAHLPWIRPQIIAVEDIERVWCAGALRKKKVNPFLRAVFRRRTRIRVIAPPRLTLGLTLRGDKVRTNIVVDNPDEAYDALCSAMLIF